MVAKWRLTTIWKALEKRARTAGATRTLLESCMGDIETVLAKGGSAPKDFTLHDEDHAFRVAERMCEVVPKTVLAKLSGYELGVLLLSAYLHDIGMSPGHGRIEAYYNFVLIGESGSLVNEERNEFQEWLDSEGYALTPPLVTTVPTADDLRLAAELVTYFARHKHNDWSKDWINENLEKFDWKGYPNWRDDLIDVCQSHHWGHDKLIEDSFDPKVLHSGDVVHLRYLACALRIADILENDPERTPDVILRHRDIAPASRIYWWKDHDFVLQIEKTRTVTLRARPRTAVGQRAVLVTASAIEKELRLCDRLSVERPFSQLPKGESLPHFWNLSDTIFVDVRPYKAAFEYIEGAFRPNTRSLLELLAGQELYGSHMAAVRELIQNAFDAVREQIAYERLLIPDADNPADAAWATRLGSDHKVTITLEADPNDPETNWLVCTDDGIGMTKSIIENNLLISGNSRRRDVLTLERRCQMKGFSSERTGKFGIGVLSYFMIAEEVQIITRRNQIAGDADGEAWTFSSTGVGDFGELRRIQAGPGGTTIRLKINKKIGLIFDSEVESSSSDPSLRAYLDSVLKWNPCDVFLQNLVESKPPIHFPTGWTKSAPLALSASTFGFDPEVTRVYQNALTLIRTETEQGFLEENLGRYRLSLSCFELEGGASLAYFHERKADDQLEIVRVNKKDCVKLESVRGSSYKGIAVNDDESNPHMVPGCVLEIDWISADAGRISVDRATFRLSDASLRAMEVLYRQIKSKAAEFVRDHAESRYSAFNRELATPPSRSNAPSLSPAGEPPRFWLILPKSRGANRVWAEVRFPAVWLPSRALMSLLAGTDLKTLVRLVDKYDDDGLDSALLKEGCISWQGKPTTLLSAVKTSSYDGTFWNVHHFPPHRILANYYLDSSLSVAPFWTGPPTKSDLSQCEFPPNWTQLLGIQLSDEETDFPTIFNINHPLRHLGYNSYSLGQEFDAAISILLLGKEGFVDAWNDLVATSPEETKQMFRKLWSDVGCEPQDIMFLSEKEFPKVNLIIWSESDSRLIDDPAVIASHLPINDPEWTLQFADLDLETLLM